MYVVRGPAQAGSNQHAGEYRPRTLHVPYKRCILAGLASRGGFVIRALVVEDVARLSGHIVNALTSAGFQAEAVSTAAAAEERLFAGNFDVVVLDLGLPDMDGLDLLKDLRQAGMDIPALVLTARVALADRIRGLDVGADDYMIKPFAFEELIARLRALLRRPGKLIADRLEIGNVAFDAITREVTIAGRPAVLGAKEQILLELLLRPGGSVVTRSSLEDGIYGEGGERAGNALEVLVHRLRARLVSYGANIEIRTIRGVGYMPSVKEQAGG